MTFTLKKMMLTLALSSSVLTMAACGDAGSSSKESKSEQPNSEWPEELVIVQYANDENEQSPTAHSAFREHLEAELGIPVTELDGGGSYAPGIEALASGNLDVMLVSPQSYSAARKKADAKLIATIDEDTNYYSQFITQADNDEINSLEDLKGKSFAFVDANSTSGYLYPKATLVEELGLEPNRIEESGYFFENVALSGGHDNSMLAVSMGDYDAAAVASTVYRRATEGGIVNDADFKTIGESVKIPNASYAVRGDLPEDFILAIQEAFLSFDDSDYFSVIYDKPEARFMKIDETYYEPAVKAMELIGAIEEE